VVKFFLPQPHPSSAVTLAARCGIGLPKRKSRCAASFSWLCLSSGRRFLPYWQLEMTERSLLWPYSKLETPQSKLTLPHCKLETSHCQLETPRCKLTLPHFRLETSHCKLETPRCKPTLPHFKLETPHCKLEMRRFISAFLKNKGRLRQSMYLLTRRKQTNYEPWSAFPCWF
jgi:hypothetical protein